MKQVAIYVRVSSEDQIENTSIESQIADCRAYIARRGWGVYDVYADEGKSAWRNEYKRRELARLRQDVKLRRVDGVVVWKFDRLARVARLQHILKDEFKHIDFESATENVDLKTSGGAFTHGILAQVAQYQSDQQSERIARALRYKAEQGEWVGPVPLGYDKTGQTLAPNAAAAAIKLAYTLYATRQHSYTTIADILNTQGYRTADGRVFGREGIRWMLHNRAYLGYVASGGVEYPGQHPALIDQRLWDDCHTIQEDRTREAGNAGLKAQGLLTGLVRCAVCGATMWQHISISRYGKPTIYYRCSGNSRRTCQIAMQRADRIDVQAIEVLHGMTVPDRLVAVVLSRLQTRAAPPKAGPDRAAIQAQMQRLTDMYIAGRIERSNYDQRYAYLHEQLSAAPAAPVIHIDIERAVQFLSDLPALLAATSIPARRSVLQSIFDRLWLADHAIQAITPREAYATLIDAMAHACSVERVADGWQLPAPHIPPLWIALQAPRPSILAYAR